jgi:predicted NAD/FAD-binding protein
MRDTSSNQVVVLGASMAGLLAARVLSERFERVVVIERDGLPPIGGHRRGVPHGRHLHGLHPRGREILDELFPGFTACLTASGAVSCDVLGGPALAAVRLPAAAGGPRPSRPVRQPAVS